MESSHDRPNDGSSNGDTPLLDELEAGQWPSFVTELKRAAEALARRGRSGATTGAVLRRQHGPLETRRDRGRPRLRRRRRGPLFGHAGGVSGRQGVPHAADQRAGRLLLHDRQAPPVVRRVGPVRQRPGEPSRFHRRHHPAGHVPPRTSSRASTPWPRSASTWAGRAARCGRSVAAWASRAASMRASTRWTSPTT